ncbi:MAG: hypothetical protein QM756_13695 [Polyangiaceae bacterium]
MLVDSEITHQVRRADVVARNIDGAVQLRFPVSLLSRELARSELELGRPSLVRRGSSRQLRNLLTFQLLIEALQVFEQQSPRHAVDDQVVNHEEQTRAAVLVAHVNDAPQRPALDVEATLCLLGQRLDLRARSDAAVPDYVGRALEHVGLTPSAVRSPREAQTQGFMVVLK